MENHKIIKVSAIASCFNGAKYLPAFLDNAAAQTISGQAEIVLVHNSPTDEERALVGNFQLKHPGLLRHIVVEREPLAVSTNRAIRAAQGEYLCVWNVDDLRTADSLEKMAKTLDQNPGIGFTYGDFVVVRQWQAEKGERVESPDFDKKEFARSMHLGPFYMWRRDLCKKIGYWDEQFKSGADFDYAARLAVESEGKKTEGLLGYYLNEGIGLSTGKTPWQPIERTVIELRFGVYGKLDFWYYTRAIKYRLRHVLLDGEWQNLSVYAPHLEDLRQPKIWLLWALFRYPFWIISRLAKKLVKIISI